MGLRLVRLAHAEYHTDRLEQSLERGAQRTLNRARHHPWDSTALETNLEVDSVDQTSSMESAPR